MASEERDEGALVYASHDGQVWCVAWSPDGKRLASAGSDEVIRVSDATTGQSLVECLGGHPTAGLAWTPDGTRVITGGWSHDINVWDAASGELLTAHPTAFDTVFGMALSPDGRRVAIAGAHEHHPEEPALVQIMDLEVGRMGMVYAKHTGSWTQDVAWSPDGALVASAGYDDSTTRIWRPESGTTVATSILPGNREEIYDVSWSPDSRRVAAATERGLHIYDAATGWLIRQDLKQLKTTDVAWSPNGRLLGAILYDHRPYFYDVNTVEAVYEYTGQGRSDTVRRATAFAWAPDGRRVATGSSDGGVHVWIVPFRFQ
jgi:WD40 repeat protein